MGYIKFHLNATEAILECTRPPFNEKTLKAVLTANLLTDIYMALPSFLRRGPSEQQALNFHFDNLFSWQEVKDYRKNLEERTKICAQEIILGLEDERDISEKNNLLFLFLLGTTLHAIQDFYCHSNWIELWDQESPNGVLPAWHEVSREEDFLAKLFTGKYKIKHYPPFAIDHAEMNLDTPQFGKSKIHTRNGKTYYEIALELAKKESTHWINNLAFWINEARIWQALASGSYLREKILKILTREYNQIKNLYDSAQHFNLQTIFGYIKWRNSFADLMKELWRNFGKSTIEKRRV